MDTLKLIKIKYKDKINCFILLGLTVLFPLNQQLHVKPFPDVDGFIIDYLMLKISIPELLIVLITIFQIRPILDSIKSERLVRYVALTFSLFSTVSILFSKYQMVAIYENLIMVLLILNLLPFIRSSYLNLNLFVNSIKIWMVLLSILGFSQFWLQESVLNSYALFGEFPYSEDYYHIKQKGFLFEDLIPPYAIFSHSNIFGGFILLSIMFLGVAKKDSIYFHLTSLLLFLIIGSLNILICYLIWIAFTKIPRISRKEISFAKVFFLLLTIYFLQLFMSLNYAEYSGNFSLFRRLYMFDLSFNSFIENPTNLFISGYYNYFYIVKDQLYRYEVVRFFQPPHNLFNILIWQYGVLFLISLFMLLNYLFKRIPQDLVKLVSVVLVASMFDHFFITNHQLKFFVFLIIPYSLIAKNSIK